MKLSRSAVPAGFLIGAVFMLSGCASLLPQAKQETQTPWHTYAEAHAMFDQIVPGKTALADLKALRVDPGQTSNVALLSHTDLLRRLFPTSSLDIRTLDPGLQECVASPNCFGYEIEQISLHRRRFGNFWADFFNFRRHTDISGWQFNAVIVIKEDKVVYKMWSGKPSIHQLEQERIPLGPLQSIGPALIQR